ncbi:MAG TPA: hypothetical protein VE690_09915 [Rhodopila sp.]|nr:hypothetical protein [Rhodopila sp.]
MSRDPLARLLRLRHRAVEQARLAVAAAAQQEGAIIAAIRRIDDDAERDRRAAAELHRADPLLGPMLAAGRERLRAERAGAEGRLAEAEAVTAARRAELAAARTEAEAVETLIANRQAAAAAERRAAHELDDVFRAQLLRRQRTAAE